MRENIRIVSALFVILLLAACETSKARHSSFVLHDSKNFRALETSGSGKQDVLSLFGIPFEVERSPDGTKWIYYSTFIKDYEKEPGPIVELNLGRDTTYLTVIEFIFSKDGLFESTKSHGEYFDRSEWIRRVSSSERESLVAAEMRALGEGDQK